MTSAKISNANNSWNIYPNELKFGTRVEFMNVFYFQKKNSQNLMTSAFFKEKLRLLIFADFINSSKKIFLETRDIYKPYLPAKFELIWKNIQRVISSLNFCWRQQNVWRCGAAFSIVKPENLLLCAPKFIACHSTLTLIELNRTAICNQAFSGQHSSNPHLKKVTPTYIGLPLPEISYQPNLHLIQQPKIEIY